MNAGDLVTFSTAERSRENLPVLRADCVGRPVVLSDANQAGDQLGVMRIVSGDRVRIVELREDFALVRHVRFKDGLCLVSLSLLKPIPEELQTPITREEDAKL